MAKQNGQANDYTNYVAEHPQGEQLNGAAAQNLNIVVDKVPYLVAISPFDFNGEKRYYVSVNGGEQHVFARDEQLSGFRAIDDNGALLPSGVEEEISRHLK